MSETDRPERVPESELRIEFAKRTDRKGKDYFLAKTKLPLNLDLTNTAFFFWIDDKGGPSMTVRIGKEHDRSDVADDEQLYGRKG